MGYCVIAQVTIDIFLGMIPNKTLNRIIHILEEEEVTNLYHNSNSISFDTSGNKGIDYNFLDKIKKLLEDNKEVESFEISACEFIESGDNGYYYNSDDDEE